MKRYALGLDLLLRYLEKVHGKGAPLPPSVLTRRMLADWYADLKHGGLHGKDRSDATRRKIVEVGQLAWKWLYDNDETGAEIPMPRTLRMAREPAKPTVAPNWAEMDTVIASHKGWHQRLAIVLRFTGLRCQQALGSSGPTSTSPAPASPSAASWARAGRSSAAASSRSHPSSSPCSRPGSARTSG